MPASISIRIDDRGLLRRVWNFPTLALKAIAKELDQQNELTVSTIIQKRLSFPKSGPSTLEGLRVQSGRLRRSIRRTLAQVDFASGNVTSAIGSNVAYAGIHEEGFTGTVQVGGHIRRMSGRRSFKFGGAARQRLTQGRDVFVRPHSRQVNLPARRYIQRSIEERLPEYGRKLSEAIVRSWEKDQGQA